MPLLSRLYGLNAASPLAALTQQQQTPQLGFEWQNQAMLPQTQGPTNGAVAQGPAKQSAPFDPSAPQVQRPGFWGQAQDRLANLDTNPLFNIGMSLLGNAQGSNWAGVGQDVREFGQARTQRQALENEQRRQKFGDARDNTIFERQQTEWGQEDQQRTNWEQAVAAASPEEQARLRAIGPTGYAQYIGNREERDWRTAEGERDRAAQIRAAGIAANYRRDPRDTIQYRNDMARLGAMGEAANFANVYVQPRLSRAREIVARLSEIGGMDNPLSADRRIQLSQMGQFGPEARGLLQELRRIQTEFTVEDARALAPVSNTDFGRLQEINPNGNMTVDAAYRILDGMEQEVTRGLSNYSAAAQWADQHGGLTGTLDAQGRTFEAAYGAANRPPQQGGDGGGAPPPAPAPQAPPRFSAGPPPQAAVAALRRDSSAEARREFDEVFGHGAAARALNGDRIRVLDTRPTGGSLR